VRVFVRLGLLMWFVSGERFKVFDLSICVYHFERLFGLLGKVRMRLLAVICFRRLILDPLGDQVEILLLVGDFLHPKRTYYNSDRFKSITQASRLQ
jgi:hypothetical protein